MSKKYNTVYILAFMFKHAIYTRQSASLTQTKKMDFSKPITYGNIGLCYEGKRPKRSFYRGHS